VRDFVPARLGHPYGILLVEETVRRYATIQDLPVPDFQAWATDPATGGMAIAISVGGDGVHAGILGQKVFGQGVADYLTALILTASPACWLAHRATHSSSLGTLYSRHGHLRPSAELRHRLAPAEATTSMLTYFPASYSTLLMPARRPWRTLPIVYRRLAGSAVGDRIAHSSVVTVPGVTGRTVVEHHATPYIYPAAFALGADVTRHVLRAGLSCRQAGRSSLTYEQSGLDMGTFDVTSSLPTN
jgi:hypothetical protein